jgi:hypothetical protein
MSLVIYITSFPPTLSTFFPFLSIQAHRPLPSNLHRQQV